MSLAADRVVTTRLLINAIWWQLKDAPSPQCYYHVVYVVITLPWAHSCVVRPHCSEVCLSWLKSSFFCLIRRQPANKRMWEVKVDYSSKWTRPDWQDALFFFGHSDQNKQARTEAEYLALLEWACCGVEGCLERGVVWQLLSEVHINVWRKGKKPVLGRFRGPG